MKKTTLSLIVAGTLVAGGLAQAQTTYDTPVQAGEASTMTQGQPNQLSSSSDPRVLGAGPTTVMVPMEQYTYVQPGWSGSYHQRHQAAATFNTPARAGEASTMTGGQPNVSTDNQRVANDVAVPVYSIPSY
jgi:hypothetical protein